MSLYAVLLLTLAAILGFSLVVLGVRYHRSSLKLGLSHAVVALTGVLFLAIQIYIGPTDKYNNIAALLFFLAITGGLMLFALREPDRAPPMMLVLIHATAALSGLFILIIGYLK